MSIRSWCWRLAAALLATLAVAITITQRGGMARWLGNGIQLRALR